MKACILFLVVLPVLLGAGCASRGGLTPAQRAEAGNLLDLARSFEATGDLRRATDLYTSVAENYPLSDGGAEAAYKAGLLRVNPHNPVRSDTLALLWFRTSLSRQAGPDVRMHTENYIAGLEHVGELRQDLNLYWQLCDSLRTVVRRQGVTIAAFERRTQSLEQQLFAANVELKKLKDVDIQLDRRNRRR